MQFALFAKGSDIVTEYQCVLWKVTICNQMPIDIVTQQTLSICKSIPFDRSFFIRREIDDIPPCQEIKLQLPQKQ